MISGQKITIFLDPITQTNAEGTATLVARFPSPPVQVPSGSHIEFWDVLFIADNQPVRRLILVDSLSSLPKQ